MKVKVGVVELGFMGSAHARVYRQLKEYELVGVCDSNSGKKHLAHTYHCRFSKISRTFLKRNWMQ